MEGAEHARRILKLQQAEADAALDSAEEIARAAGTDPAMTDTVARQRLELRRVAADREWRRAQQQIDDATGAQTLIEAAATADREYRARQIEVENARAAVAEAAIKERSAEEQLRRVDLLEGALDARIADDSASVAQGDVDKHTALLERLELEATEREVLEKRRGAIALPPADSLGRMRRLANDLAGARGALNVGLVVTVTPAHPIQIRLNKDGMAEHPSLTDKALEVEADAEVDIEFRDIATVLIRGGRRAAQQTAESLETRWSLEVAPYLEAANVADLEGLSAKIAEAQELDRRLKASEVELRSLEAQIASLGDPAQKMRAALERKNACRAALGDVPFETLASELAALGAEPAYTLRERRQRASKDLELARSSANQAATNYTLAQERPKNSSSELNTAVVARNAALAAFPEGVAATLSAAQADLAAASREQRDVVAELASLESMIAAQNARVEAAVREARANAEKTREQLITADAECTKAITDHASQAGRLVELRRVRGAQDLVAAENRLRNATDRHAALPVPECIVAEAEVIAAQNAEARAKSDLLEIQREIERTHGALVRRHTRATLDVVPAVASRVPLHDRRSRRSAGAKRRYADGLVPRSARGEGPQLPDRCVHVSARRLPRCQCRNAQREGRS